MFYEAQSSYCLVPMWNWMYIRCRNLSGLRAIFSPPNKKHQHFETPPKPLPLAPKSSSLPPCWNPGRLDRAGDLIQSGIWMPKKARWIWALDGGNFQNTRTTRHGDAWRLLLWGHILIFKMYGRKPRDAYFGEETLQKASPDLAIWTDIWCW